MFGQVIWDMTKEERAAMLDRGAQPTFEVATDADGGKFIRGSFVDQPDPDPTGRSPIDWPAITRHEPPAKAGGL